MEADYLFTDVHLLTMEGDGVGYIAHGAVAILGNKIVAVGKTADLAPKVSAKEHMALPNRAILPGLIDAHMHTPLAIVRGVAQDVKNWMQAALAPFFKTSHTGSIECRHATQRHRRDESGDNHLWRLCISA